MTKIQFKDEQSKLETEAELLVEEQKNQLKDYAAQLLQLMKEQGVNVESTSEKVEFDELIQRCKLAF